MTKICSVPHCAGAFLAKGFCKKHYERFRSHGDPLAPHMISSGSRAEYYNSVVLNHDGDDCLIWPLSRRNGYGTLRVNGRETYVHRVLCEETNGEPPTPSHVAAHSCGNGHLGCVTKRHLSWKTPSENSADRVMHGTHNRGERHNMAKLTEAQVAHIRSLRGSKSMRSIGKDFGVCAQTICNVLNNNTWATLITDDLSRAGTESGVLRTL